MGLATGGTWKGSLIGAELDGVDMWDAITSNTDSPRTEIAHYVDKFGNVSVQIDMMKIVLTAESEIEGYGIPQFATSGEASEASCLSV